VPSPVVFFREDVGVPVVFFRCDDGVDGDDIAKVSFFRDGVPAPVGVDFFGVDFFRRDSVVVFFPGVPVPIVCFRDDDGDDDDDDDDDGGAFFFGVAFKDGDDAPDDAVKDRDDGPVVKDRDDRPDVAVNVRDDLGRGGNFRTRVADG